MSDHDIDNQLREPLPRLHRFACWLTRDENQADDLTQSTLEKALSHWHQRRDDSALRPWLFAIAYRQFVDNQRRARRYVRVLELFGRTVRTETPSLEREVVAQSIIQALNRLPDAQRHLLLWVSVEGLGYRDIADMLDIPIGTVMSRLSRARAALRQLTDGDSLTMRLPADPLADEEPSARHATGKEPSARQLAHKEPSTAPTLRLLK